MTESLSEPTAQELGAHTNETRLPDGRWRTDDGRTIDPRMGDGKLIALNVAWILGLPVVVAIAVPWYLLTHGLGWQETLAALVLYWATGLAITAGYHRLFSHRGYKAKLPIRVLSALFGGMAAQNSVFSWAAQHRYHHLEVDTIGDPYNSKRGFWFSHLLWVLRDGAHADDRDNISDLLKDPVLQFQDDHYLAVMAGGNLAAVTLLGWLTGEWAGMFIIAGLARILAVQHSTFFINSWAHMWGTRPWSTANSAKDNWLLSFFSFGEGYHNYHHAFMHDYRNGVRWYQWDPSKWAIYLASKVGLASDLRRVPDDVLLRARYARGKGRLEERLEGWGENVDEWSHRLASRRADMEAAVRDAMDAAQARLADLQDRRDALLESIETSLRERGTSAGEELVGAGERLDAALDELQARRRAWTAAKRRALYEAGEELQTDLQELKQAMREARRQAKIALHEWEALLAAYIEGRTALATTG
jgi:stearoyl-CoA desaturase (Delta-9 desaturase)